MWKTPTGIKSISYKPIDWNVISIGTDIFCGSWYTWILGNYHVIITNRKFDIRENKLKRIRRQIETAAMISQYNEINE